MENMDYVAATAVAIITKAYIERRIKENRKMMKKKREKKENEKKNGIVECKEMYNFNRLIR